MTKKHGLLLHSTTIVAGVVAVCAFAVWTNLYLDTLYRVQGLEFGPSYRVFSCDVNAIPYGAVAMAGSILLRLVVGLGAMRLIRSRIQAGRLPAAMMLLPLFCLLGVDLNSLLGVLIFHIGGIEFWPLNNAVLSEAGWLGLRLFGSVYPVTVAMVAVFGVASVILSREISTHVEISTSEKRTWLAVIVAGIVLGGFVWFYLVGRIVSFLFYR